MSIMCFLVRRGFAGAAQLVMLMVLAGSPVFMANLYAADTVVPDGISQDEAVTLVRQHTKGKVIRVDRKADGVTVFYRVRVLTPDGRLREYQVDAVSGAIR
ncbi:MAG: PepSY domain-containing protein [Gammaproteobacteria bacterium]